MDVNGNTGCLNLLMNLGVRVIFAKMEINLKREWPKMKKSKEWISGAVSLLAGIIVGNLIGFLIKFFS